MQQTSNDIVMLCLSFLNLFDVVRYMRCNKECHKDATNALKQNKFYYFVGDNKWQQFCRSELYNYCSHLVFSSEIYSEIKLPKHCKMFSITSDFNNKLELNDELQMLKISETFNHVIDLPGSLIKLHMSGNFNRPLILPPFLKSWVMSNSFNKIIQLPTQLQILHMGENFNQPIELPSSLRDLIMGHEFNQPIVLPPLLQILDIGDEFNQHLDPRLPSTLKYLRMGSKFQTKVILPSTLTHFRMGYNYNQHLEFPNTLEVLELGRAYSFAIPRLPTSLRQFEMSQRFNNYFTLPEHLTELFCGLSFDQPLILNCRMVDVRYRMDFCSSCNWPLACKCFQVNRKSAAFFRIHHRLHQIMSINNFFVTCQNYDGDLGNELLSRLGRKQKRVIIDDWKDLAMQHGQSFRLNTFNI